MGHTRPVNTLEHLENSELAPVEPHQLQPWQRPKQTQAKQRRQPRVPNINSDSSSTQEADTHQMATHDNAKDKIREFICLNTYNIVICHIPIMLNGWRCFYYEDSTLSTFAYKPASRNKQVQTLATSSNSRLKLLRTHHLILPESDTYLEQQHTAVNVQTDHPHWTSKQALSLPWLCDRLTVPTSKISTSTDSLKITPKTDETPHR